MIRMNTAKKISHRSYRYCLVPCCINTTSKNPNKLFFSVPRGKHKRNRWLNAMKRDEKKNKKLSATSSLFCCEDHFTLQDDMENYMQWYLTKNVRKFKLKDGVVPHKFDCQKSVTIPCDRPAARKRKHMEVINALLSQPSREEYNIPRIKHRQKKNATPSQNLRILPTYNVEREKQIEDERQKRLEDKNGNTPSKVTEESSKVLGLTEIKVEAPELVSEKNEFTKTDTETCEDALADEDDELMNVKLELYEAFTDISNLRKEKEMLTKKLSTTEAAQNMLQKSVSERQKELMIIRLKLQQAYREVDELKNKKEELLEKLRDEDIVESTFEDPDKLYFYTGLNSIKDFTYLLSLICNVDGHFRTVTLKKQLLIVLMKLKLDLYMKDLAYRFQISASTVARICDYIIPILQAKIELLLKCPINAALRKNIPVSFKNTVYENLYQKLVEYSKSKTKQPEEEEGGTDFE